MTSANDAARSQARSASGPPRVLGDVADTVEFVPRYTPPSEHEPDPPYRRRSRSVRIGVWVLLVGVIALVFTDIFAALI